MKPGILKSQSGKAASSIALAAAMLAVPAVIPPQLRAEEPVQRSTTAVKMPDSLSSIYTKYAERFVKLSERPLIVGIDAGHTIYKNSSGEMFYIEASTGDMKFLTRKQASKLVCCKVPEKVSLVGVDNQGNTLQKNSRGEVFYLRPTTGDMVFVK